MDNMRKCLVTCGVVAMGVVGILLIVNSVRHRKPAGMCEKVGEGIDESVRESKAALEKATVHVQKVFEHIKNRKR